MAQTLVFVAAVAFMLLWTFAWGVIATGSPRAAFEYLRTWLRVIGITVVVSAAVFLIAWPLMR